MKLWYAAKPTIAAVQGWCVGGGTDMVLCADIIIAAEGASFGYPPSRVWGTPTTAMWVYRMGLERAKRYLLTGDEIPAPDAARIGLVLETVADDRLQEHALAFARRMAQVPTSQLVMLKLLCNQTAENMGLSSSRTLGSLFDGIARHTQERLDFVARARPGGFRQAGRERLGGYDAITAVANDLLPRLQADPQLGRFWAHRGEDGLKREKQLLIDFLCASAGGPVYYRGRDMLLVHRGMRISESDWNVFLG